MIILSWVLAAFAVVLVMMFACSIRMRRRLSERTDALLQLQAFHRMLVTDMPGLICRLQPDGALSFVNDEYCRFFGRSREEIVGTNGLLLVVEEDRCRVLEQAGEFSSSFPVTEIEHRATRFDGEIVWMRWVVRALFDHGGGICAYQALGLDVTDKRILADQNVQSQKLETIGRLAGGIAHDFNNSLQAIQGLSEVALLPGRTEAERIDDIRHVLEAARHAGTLTRQLLTFSRKLPIEAQELNLNEIVERQAGMLPRVLGEDVRLDVDLVGNLQPVRADVGHLEQVLVNLVLNARDAMPDGGRISVRTFNITFSAHDVSRYDDARPGVFVGLAVTDTGSGMTPEVRQRLFEPFFTTKVKGRGTGQGLAIVYSIVRQHGGWIHVYSQMGQGSTFKIFLPAVDGLPTAGESSGGLIVNAPVVKTGRIMVIEDEMHLARLAAKILESVGHKVLIVSSVAEARVAFENGGGAFDLVFADVVLRDGTSLEVLEDFLRQSPWLRFLFTSGYADDRSRWVSIMKNGWTCLIKPYTAKTLLENVDAELRAADEASSMAVV